MKHSNLFVALGALILLIVAILADKANKKNSVYSTVLYYNWGIYGTAWAGAGFTPIVTTSTVTGHVAYFNVGSYKYTLFTSVNYTKLYLPF